MTMPKTSAPLLLHLTGPVAAAPEAPTAPVEAPPDVPARQDPNPREPEKTDDPDIDEQIKRIIREIPDPTPQPGGE